MAALLTCMRPGLSKSTWFWPGWGIGRGRAAQLPKVNRVSFITHWWLREVSFNDWIFHSRPHQNYFPSNLKPQVCKDTYLLPGAEQSGVEGASSKLTSFLARTKGIAMILSDIFSRSAATLWQHVICRLPQHKGKPAWSRLNQHVRAVTSEVWILYHLWNTFNWYNFVPGRGRGPGRVLGASYTSPSGFPNSLRLVAQI